jgi:molybdopterin-guanine dinucleotide biosynthesis protein A
MGTDKANLRRDGQSLLERTVTLAAEAGAPAVAVIGRTRPANWPAALSATIFLPDDRPDQGPLGGIETAMHWAQNAGHEYLCVVPCDLPLLTADALRWLQQSAANYHALNDGLAVHGADNRVEPLFTIYATHCLPAIAQQQATGRRSPTALIDAGNFHHIDAPPFVQTALTDADTPEAWAAIMATKEEWDDPDRSATQTMDIS